MFSTNRKLEDDIEIMLGDKLQVCNDKNSTYTVFLDETKEEIGVEHDIYKTWIQIDKFLDSHHGKINVIGNITKRIII